jgi:1,4-dihydroxy-2-naphthoate octaprenyltransferase
MINWNTYLLGQAWLTILQLGIQYINEYFDFPADQSNPNRTFLTGGSGALGEGKLPRRVALLSGLTCLAMTSSLTVLIIANVRPSPGVYLIMAFGFLGSFFYSVPPLRLEASGYGELVTAFLVAFLIPAFSFNLQTGSLHRLLTMCGFPLLALILAMLIALELPDYVNDLQHDKRTLMVRLGWQAAMGLHNILILSAFLLVILAGLFGFPRFAMIAGLLPLPLGVFQVWQMRGIANGAKPHWDILTLVALALFGITTYLLAFSFWVN